MQEGVVKVRVLIVLLLICVSNNVHAADLAVLKAQIEATIPRARGDVGIAIKHLESGTELLVNSDRTYPMASAFKLPILVELYYKKAAGALSLDERVDIKPGDLHIGTGSMIALY